MLFLITCSFYSHVTAEMLLKGFWRESKYVMNVKKKKIQVKLCAALDCCRFEIVGLRLLQTKPLCRKYSALCIY